MKAELILKTASGETLSETKLLSFGFVKDAYTPYTTLTARFDAADRDFSNTAEVFLYIREILVHHGLADSIEYTAENGKATAVISSRGFTSQLCQNQLEPGMKTGISINSLMDSFYTLPFVTHEDNSDTSGYIYVKSGSTLWDGVVNLAYKQCGLYPYIRGTNCVRITQEAVPSHFEYDDSELITRGHGSVCKRLTSHFHMADISGNYGLYELENTSVSALKIIRHRFFELDQQFLYSPQQALEYRNKYAARASRRYFCRYSGYNGEDLSDTAAFGQVKIGRIGRIEITGDSTGIFTEISVYSDGFYTAVTV